jgi:hypothetical protein
MDDVAIAADACFIAPYSPARAHLAAAVLLESFDLHTCILLSFDPPTKESGAGRIRRSRVWPRTGFPATLQRQVIEQVLPISPRAPDKERRHGRPQYSSPLILISGFYSAFERWETCGKENRQADDPASVPGLPKNIYDSQSNSFFSPKPAESSELQAKARFMGNPL